MVEKLSLSKNETLFVLPRGGRHFTRPIFHLQPDSMPELAECARRWPHENGETVNTIQSEMQTSPQKQLWLACETAFFADLPQPARYYALPAAERAQGYERFGADGLFHAWAAHQNSQANRLVSIHLCGNTTLAAIHNGKAIDTSAGYSALEGLPGLSTCGDIDPSLIGLFNEKGLSPIEIRDQLYQNSGWRALVANATFTDLINSSDPAFALPRTMLTYALYKSIGAMLSALGGADLIFIGCENEVECRSFFTGLRQHFAFTSCEFQLKTVPREKVLLYAWSTGQ